LYLAAVGEWRGEYGLDCYDEKDNLIVIGSTRIPFIVDENGFPMPTKIYWCKYKKPIVL
jgi:hypothetical protein